MVAQQAIEERDRTYPALRYIADLMTLTRFLTAAFIVVIGMIAGPRALPAAVIATMVGWVTDVIDGPAGRGSGTEPTWVARLDFTADLALAYSFFLFVVITGLLPILLALGLVLAGAIIVILRPTEHTVQIVTAPIFGLPVALSFHAGLAVGITYLGLLACLMVLRWNSLVENIKGAHSEYCK